MRRYVDSDAVRILGIGMTNSSTALIRRTAIILFSGLLTWGCSGDDGRPGPQGDPGPVGPEGPPGTSVPGVSGEAKTLDARITNMSISDATVVNFSVRNEHDVPFVGLSAGNVRFTLAKLIPAANGHSSRWQSYINRRETAGSVGPGTQDTIQATAERNGTFVSHGDGSYSYTFASDIRAITTPLAVSYEPELTHRVALQISGGDIPVANADFTWRPGDGSTSGITGRDIVSTASCNECHGKLAIHGGGRTEVKYCVTCHNPGSVDANSGNTVDFTVMVHKIHRGEQLPSVQAGGEYAIWGFRDSKHDYSHVTYPQDIRNCSKCHNDADADTPQAAQWQTRPTREACGACHDDVNFATGQGHSAANFVAENHECSICHSDGGFVGSVARSHQIPEQLAAQRFTYNLLEIRNTAPGEFPEVRFSVTDPENNAAPYDLKADPAFTNLANRASRLFVQIGWSTTDVHNSGSGAAPGLPVSINALTASTDNGDGSYTVTSPVAVPANAGGSGIVALEGHPAADFDGDGVYSDRVPVKNAVDFFAITDTTATPRRAVVDMAKCNDCHGNLSLHGNNRTGEAQVCAICHNANATDINRRPGDPTTTADGKKEESIDFKTMIHAIHSAGMRQDGVVLYGFGNREHDFGDVVYPGVLENCTACHVNDSYTLPLASGVLGSTIDTAASRSDPADDLNITPSAAACASCHDGDLARSHMEQNGASFATPQSMIDNGSFIETCAICHGPGRSADVSTAHGLR